MAMHITDMTETVFRTTSPDGQIEQIPGRLGVGHDDRGRAIFGEVVLTNPYDKERPPRYEFSHRCYEITEDLDLIGMTQRGLVLDAGSPSTQSGRTIVQAEAMSRALESLEAPAVLLRAGDRVNVQHGAGDPKPRESLREWVDAHFGEAEVEAQHLPTATQYVTSVEAGGTFTPGVEVVDHAYDVSYTLGRTDDGRYLMTTGELGAGDRRQRVVLDLESEDARVLREGLAGALEEDAEVDFQDDLHVTVPYDGGHFRVDELTEAAGQWLEHTDDQQLGEILSTAYIEHDAEVERQAAERVANFFAARDKAYDHSYVDDRHGPDRHGVVDEVAVVHYVDLETDGVKLGSLGLGHDSDGQLLIGTVESTANGRPVFMEVNPLDDEHRNPFYLHEAGDGMLQTLAGLREESSTFCFDTTTIYQLDEMGVESIVDGKELAKAGFGFCQGQSEAAVHLRAVLDHVRHQVEVSEIVDEREDRYTQAQIEAEERIARRENAVAAEVPYDPFDAARDAAMDMREERLSGSEAEGDGSWLSSREEFAAAEDDDSWLPSLEEIEASRDERVVALDDRLDALRQVVEQWNPHSPAMKPRIESWTAALDRAEQQIGALDPTNPDAERLVELTDRMDKAHTQLVGPLDERQRIADGVQRLLAAEQAGRQHETTESARSVDIGPEL